MNPKRMQREVNKEKNRIHLSTQSQEAMKLQLEAKKKQLKQDQSKKKIGMKNEIFEKKQEKKKKKKRGK